MRQPEVPGWTLRPANQRRMGWPHAIYGFVQNKAQALLDVSFYKVCDDQKGEIMCSSV